MGPVPSGIQAKPSAKPERPNLRWRSHAGHPISRTAVCSALARHHHHHPHPNLSATSSSSSARLLGGGGRRTARLPNGLQDGAPPQRRHALPLPAHRHPPLPPPRRQRQGLRRRLHAIHRLHQVSLPGPGSRPPRLSEFVRVPPID
jgi:hypothetical protein